MREVQVTLPELGLLVGTRAALGARLGLLLADCLPESQRKAVGWTLLLVGAFTPLLSRSRCSARSVPRPQPDCRSGE